MENWEVTIISCRGANLGTNSKTGIGSTAETFAEKDAWTLSALKIPPNSKCLKRS